MVLQEKEILELIEEYEIERKNLSKRKEYIANREESWTSKGAFDRQKFYKSFFSDNYRDGFIRRYPHGWVIRQADTKWYFRGEHTCYPSSQPTFVRNLLQQPKENKTVYEFVKNAKLIEFERILNRFDHYRQFKRIRLKLSFDQQISLTPLFVCIAQHYGLDTNWLDITGDFKTALFFACCKYENGKWRPLTKEDVKQNQVGRVFRRPNYMGVGNREYEVYPIGFQPFMRCHMQYGYGIWMDETMDLTKKESGFEVLEFQHSVKLSNHIFEKMGEGAKIYPHEGLTIIEKELEKLKYSKSIPESIFENVYKTMELKYTTSKLIQLLNKEGFSVTSELPRISSEKITEVNQYYKNFDIEKSYGINLGIRQV